MKVLLSVVLVKAFSLKRGKEKKMAAKENPLMTSAVAIQVAEANFTTFEFSRYFNFLKKLIPIKSKKTAYRVFLN